MTSKKLLSLVLVLCMILPIIPVFATESTQTEVVSSINYIVNHDFDDDEDVNTWLKGSMYKDSKTTQFEIGRTELEGAEDGYAMAFSASVIEGGNWNGYSPTAFLNFDDVVFEEGKKLIIETRFKQTGDANGNAWSYLKFNRPDTYDFAAGSAGGWNVEDAYNCWMMLSMQNNSLMHLKVGDFSSRTELAAVDTINNWTDVQIVINEGTKKYSIETKTGDVVAKSPDILFDAKDNAKTLSGDTAYDSLDSLTLYLRNYAQTLYVDYFRVYEISPVYTDAVIVGGSTVKYDEAIELEFINVYADADKITATTISAIPEGAVKINGASAVQSYDAENQVISVMPEGGFTEGETYTVTIDKNILADSSIIYSGTDTFKVRARGERSNGLVVNDTFENEADKDNWIIGGADDGYKAVTDIVTVDGDNKALSVKMETKTNGTGGVNHVPNIIRNIGNGIEFSEDKTVVIKARMKVKSSKIDENGAANSTKFHLKMNSIGYETGGVHTDQHQNGSWFAYSMLRLGEEGITHPTGTGRQLSAETGWYYEGATVSGTENSAILDKWVDYTITVDGINNKTIINTVCSDISLNKTTTTSTIGVSPRALVNEYGEGTTKTHFDALDTLSFALFDNANTDSELLIDYFKVVELVGGRIINQSGASAMYNEPLKFTLESDQPISAVSEGAIKIEGVETSLSYDAETQTITVTPETDLTIGNLYNVTIDKDVLENNGVGYTGITSFSVRARDERETGKVINDDFNDGTTQGWTIGASNDGYKAGLDVVDVDGEVGNKALKVSMSAVAGGNGNQPNVTRVLGNGIEFKDNEWVTIKARVKKSSEGFSYLLKANRPDTITQVENEYAWAAYGIMGNNDSGKTRTITGTQDLGDLVGGYSYLPEDPGAKTVGTDWVTYTIVFMPEEGLFWVTGVKDDGTYVTTQSGREGRMCLAGTAVEKIYGVAPAALMKLDFLDTLTFMPDSGTTGDLYIDYVDVSVKDMNPIDAYALMPEGSSVKYDEAIKLQFVSDKEISDVPAGAVKINGANALQNYDAETKILSVKPENGFASGETYTVTIDKNVLADSSIIYTGTETFKVRARGDRSNGLVVNDTFENEADKDNWIIGGADSGYKAVTDIVTVEGENKALSVKMETNTNASGGANHIPNIIRNIGNGIEFSEDKTVVIKARMKVKSSKINESGDAASTQFHLRMNSIGYETGGVHTDQHQNGSWFAYSMLRLGEEGIAHPTGTGRQLSAETGWYYDGATVSGTENSAILDKWVDYTITVDGINNKTIINAVCDDISLNKTTTTSTIGVSPRALANEYGEGTTKTHFDALDTLSFALFDNANTDSELLIDYFKVVELVGGRIINHSGASAMYNEPLKFTLESEQPISAVSEGAIKIDGVETSLSYDAETQTITVTPETDLTIGNVYNVTIDKDVLENNGVGYTGITSFSVRARDERETGKVINDDFNDGTTQGWTIGASNDAYKAGLDVVDVDGEEGNKALKVSMSAIAGGSGNQPNVTRILGNGIEFKDNEWVTIEARVKKSSVGLAYRLKANRPDTIAQVPYEYDWAAYGIMGNGASGKTTTITGTQDLGDTKGGYSYMAEDPGAKTVGTDWVTYTIVFIPEDGLFWVTGVKDDGTYVTTQSGREGAMYLAGTAVEKIYGVAPAALMKLDFLDTLTFMPYEGTTGDLYIDYVKVSVNDTSVIGKATLTVDGEEIDEITAGTTVKPSFTINPEEDVTEYTVISALYIDGILEDTHINPLTVTEMGYVYTEEDGWVIPAALEGKYEIKAFVWDTLGGMKPVSTVTKAESAAND